MADNQNPGQFGTRDALDDVQRLKQNAADVKDQISGLGQSLTSQLAGVRAIGMDVAKSYESMADKLANQVRSVKDYKKIQQEQKDLAKALIRIEVERTILLEKVKNATAAQKEELIKGLEVLLDMEDTVKSTEKHTKGIAEQAAKIASSGKAFANLAKALNQIPILGGYLSKPFALAAEHTRAAAEKGAGPLKANMLGALKAAEQLVFRMGPAVFLKSLLDASDRLGKINQTIGTGINGAKALTAEYSALAEGEGNRTNTDKLVKAMVSYNQELGTSIQLEGSRAKSFQLNTEYLGASAKAAARLDMLSRSTNQGAEEFTENLADSVSQAGRSLGVHVTLQRAMEKIATMSSTTLMNLRRTPEALSQAVALSEKLGMSFDQIRGVANSLLDFESSIANELEAEVLTGKQLNLERARAAALRGDELTLMREISSQIGTLGEFEKMNVLQREAAAKALGMTADQMGDILLKQDMISKMGKEAENASLEQLKNARIIAKEKGISDKAALVELQRQESIGKRFQDLLLKVQSKIVDFAEKYEDKIRSVLDKIENFIKNEGISKIVDFAIKGLATLAGISALRTVLTTLRGTPFMPMHVVMAGGPGGMGGAGGAMSGYGVRGAGLYNRAGYYKNGQLQNFSGKIPKGSTYMKGGLTAGGYGMIGGLAATAIGGVMQNSDSQGMQMAGGALSGAGMGVSMGAMFGPWGMAIGGILGAGYGLISSWSEAEAREREERKEAERIKEEKELLKQEREAALKGDYQSQMLKLMEQQANRNIEVYMNANKVSNALTIGTLGTD